MKTETQRLKELLTAARDRRAAIQGELATLDAADRRYAMALEVLESLPRDLPEPDAVAASVAIPASANAGLTLAQMILERVFVERDGLAGSEIADAVLRLAPTAKKGSIASVLSRLTHDAGALRRENNLYYLTVKEEGSDAEHAGALESQPSPTAGNATDGVRRRRVRRTA